ncbi:hypothetical protein C8R46DRAFT_1234143 [Mycena filopes]|nr:hypothetical protein C8R46DRAFT_1234143 [Mycena filopes]
MTLLRPPLLRPPDVDVDNSELITLIANLDLGPIDPHPGAAPPPPPSPPPTSLQSVPSSSDFAPCRARHTCSPTPPSAVPLCPCAHDSPCRPCAILLHITHPTRLHKRVTQGVPGASVSSVSPRKRKSKSKTKRAYAIFCGLRCGVLDTWAQTHPLVNGVPNCIYRGYATREAADAAYAYALARSWTRVVGTSLAADQLPRPLELNLADDAGNILNECEDLDDRWYVVYRGICPGVYRSHLECQLNTLGVPAALHEGVVGRAAAFAKYERASLGGRISNLLLSSGLHSSLVWPCPPVLPYFAFSDNSTLTHRAARFLFATFLTTIMPLAPRPPPLTSKFSTGATEHEREQERRAKRNEKARRAELKAQPLPEQARAAERGRDYQAKYREKNRKILRLWATQRRMAQYEMRFGPEAYAQYYEIWKANRRRKRQRRIKGWAEAGYAIDEIPGFIPPREDAT